MTGIIYGTGACTPSYIMDNNDIAKLVETSDEWIQERTGSRGGTSLQRRRRYPWRCRRAAGRLRMRASPRKR